MSIYHLHARLLEVLRGSPVRDETRLSETDSLDDAQRWAREQLADGFTVWIYDHGHVTPIAGASDYRMVAHERPTRAASTRPTSPPPRRPQPGTRRTAGRQAP